MSKKTRQSHRKPKKFTASQIKKAKTRIICPSGFRHIDKGRFAKTPHTRHLCIHDKKKTFFFTKKPSIGV